MRMRRQFGKKTAEKLQAVVVCWLVENAKFWGGKQLRGDHKNRFLRLVV